MLNYVLRLENEVEKRFKNFFFMYDERDLCINRGTLSSLTMKYLNDQKNLMIY